ncbi:MAG: tyrosine--tRNA ligase [Phycisphaerales bacterium]|nr:tyrosine--tRNA ligase [Phycisphaerales bacterium]
MSNESTATLIRGAAHVYTETELEHRLAASAKSGRQMRVKLGMDPTAPDIHLGHSVVLRKMRQFQDIGHRAVLIIGDFTARIGDPTGRSATRPVLTDSEIDHNAETYLQQAGAILDLSPERFEVRRNSEWLSAMKFDDVIRLTAKMTVGQMLKREDFRNRYEAQTPISLHELLYPLAQGWDSVMIEADVELGGTDQTYNNLVGRDLQSDAGKPPQIVMTMPLLRGLDGERKMSKSYGNTIAVTDTPRDMFGKTMSIPDSLLEEWFTLLTTIPETDWRARVAEHPMKAKDFLAQQVGAMFHTPDDMRDAAAWWHESFGSKKQSEAIDVALAPDEASDGAAPAWMIAWVAHGRALSKSDARRMVQGGAFEYPLGTKVTDPNAMLKVETGVEFRAGRHREGELIKQPLIGRIRR